MTKTIYTNDLMKKDTKRAYSSAFGILSDAIDLLRAIDKREAPNALMATDDLLYRACDKVNGDPQMRHIVSKITDKQSADVDVYRKALPRIAGYLDKQATKPWQKQDTDVLPG